MKRAYFIAVAALLAACGQQSSSQVPPPAASEAARANMSAQNIFCPESMGIKVENVLKNIDAGLKATNYPANVSDPSVTLNECGYAMTFTTQFGIVNINMNQQQELLTLGVGQVNKNDITENMRNSFAIIQTATSPFGRSRWGETELGNKLLEVATAVQLKANQNGGEADQEFEYGGNTFAVGTKNKNLILLVRKTVK